MVKKRQTKKRLEKALNSLKEERKIESLEKKEIENLQELKKEINNEVNPHPLTKITRADVVRSFIGALIGTVGHFAFFYGVEIAEKISMARAVSLYVLSLVVCFCFMYYSGFRKVKEVKVFRFIPVRVVVVYLVSLLVVAGTLFIFGFINFTTDLTTVFKIISTTLLLAVLGASTADILGKKL